VWHKTICIHQVSITICKITLITIRQIGNQNHKYFRGLIRTSNLLVLKTVTTSLLNFVPGLLLFQPVAWTESIKETWDSSGKTTCTAQHFWGHQFQEGLRWNYKHISTPRCWIVTTALCSKTSRVGILKYLIAVTRLGGVFSNICAFCAVRQQYSTNTYLQPLVDVRYLSTAQLWSIL
jgi:hypothetical protein